MKKTFAPLLATAFMMALPAHAEDKTDAAAPAASKDKDAVVLKVDGDDIKRGEVEDSWKDAGKYIFQGREVPPFDTMPDAMKEKFLQLNIADSPVKSPEEFARTVKDDLAVWEQIARSGNIRLD